MDLGLKDKVVFIAGSSRGIGKAISYGFAKEGSKVIVTGREKISVETTVEEFKKEFGEGNVIGICVDLSKTDEIKESLSRAVACFGRMDVVVANIGSGRGKPEYDLPDLEWNRFIDINLLSGVKIAREAVPFLKSNGGSVIFISSIAGIETLGAPIAYEASKAAIIASAKNLSYKLAQYNIRVNTVAPGNILFLGSTWDLKLKDNLKSTTDYINSNVPLKRLGIPEEVTDSVLFLASPRASFITGACLVVDGGQTRGF
ncbi:MAG: hypothetical protein VR68_09290 [Peptococcaceae bacterium BRH_c4a]|nr:MAG: hypothetical protein VR68_09290 [Peptococcaceae bacterium BRH_c4a]